jgi:hypothetical protein
VNKSIDELKDIIVDGMKLKSGEREIEIRRLPNNVIKINNKLISWIDFQDLLLNGTYELIINENELDLFASEPIRDLKKKRGGRREGSGRKKIDKGKKRKPSLFTLSPEALEALDYLCGMYGEKKSSMIDSLLIDKANTLKYSIEH